MKKSHIKLIIFDVAVMIILLLNSFILNILNNYTNMAIFLILLFVLFKIIFGFEKDNHRYSKDIILNMIIIYLSSFIIYYIFGIFIGFVRTENYLTLFGIRTFLLPYIIIIFIKECLRYQMLVKADKSKILIIISCLLFIILDISYTLHINSLNSAYNIFIFIAINLLPIISSNIVCTYISKKCGYKPNIFWLLVSGLYVQLLPFVPNVGLYIESLIRLLFPCILVYNSHRFFKSREHEIILSYEKRRGYIALLIFAVFVFVLAYFVSGLFRFYSIAIATGSMTPNVNKGDVVIVDQNYDYKKLKVGQIIAYKYEKIIVVHRLVDVVKVGDDYYFYTKGDANNDVDNYIIYPDMIVGAVNNKISYIGLPTVWLSEIW